VLYLDSSALVKRYIYEAGSEQLEQRLELGDRLFTSALSFAEVHAALGRKRREQLLTPTHFDEARRKFQYDWLFSLQVLEVNSETLKVVPEVADQFAIGGSDVVHLAAARFLRDSAGVNKSVDPGDKLFEFAVADKKLARIAKEFGFQIFDPEL
jgi:predicted nucleic acid-binding protein